MPATITKISNKVLSTRHTQQPGTVTKISTTGNNSDTFDDVAVNGVLVLAGATSMIAAAYTTNTATAATTLTAANITGGTASVDLAMTGALAAGANATLPTVANVIAALPNGAPAVGTSYRLRITNRSSGAFSWTVVTNTGWTLSGTMTIAQNTSREFVVVITSATTATLTSVATGTYS